MNNFLISGGPHVTVKTSWDGWHLGQPFTSPHLPNGVGWCWDFIASSLSFFGGRGEAPFLGSGRSRSDAPGLDADGGESLSARVHAYVTQAKEHEAVPEGSGGVLSAIFYDWDILRPGARPLTHGKETWDDLALAQRKGTAGRGSGGFTGETRLTAHVRGLLAPCVAQADADGLKPLADIDAYYRSAPAHVPGRTPIPMRAFSGVLEPATALGLCFPHIPNVTLALAPESPSLLRFKRLAWCVARTLVTPQPGRVPFEDLFFRDQRGRSVQSKGGKGGSDKAATSDIRKKRLSGKRRAANRNQTAASSTLSSSASAYASASALSSSQIPPPGASAGRSTRVIFTSRDFGATPTARAALNFVLEHAADGLGEDPRAIFNAALAAAQAKVVALSRTPAPSNARHAEVSLSLLQSTPTLGALGEWLNHGRGVRVCARRFVGLGAKDMMIGGVAEATAYRQWAGDARRRVHPNVPEQYPVQKSTDGNKVKPDMKDKASKPSDIPILFLDRGQGDNGNTVVGKYGRRFENRPEMEGVLRKYNLTYRVVEDLELWTMTFEQQQALFNSHKIVIGVHGAGMTNTLFLPLQSAIIEVTPVHMWCPLFFRQNVASGHYTFPVHSPLDSTAQTYTYFIGDDPSHPNRNATILSYRDSCMKNGHITAATTNGPCFHLAKTVPVITPLRLFEEAVLGALDAIGTPQLHRDSPLSLLEGVPSEADWREGRVPMLAHTDPDWYPSRRWGLCPPKSKCAPA